MRRLLFFVPLLFLFCASPAKAIPHVVTGQSCTNTGTTQASITCTFPNNLTAGNQLYICVDNDGNLGSVSWSGDTGTFTNDLTDFTWDAALRMTCAHCLSLTGGAKVITATVSLTTASLIIGAEFNGATGGFDQSDAGKATSSTTTITSNSITPTVNDSLIVGIIASTVATTLGRGYTLAADSGTHLYKIEYQVQVGALPIAATGTCTSANVMGHVSNIKSAANNPVYFP